MSAFDIARRRPTILEPGDNGHGPIRLVELDELLYLPDILEPGQSLCVAHGAIIPEESVLDVSAADFLRERHDQVRHRGVFDTVRSPRHVCVVGNLFSRNFGHWTEELLKVAWLERSGRRYDYVMSSLPPVARESLSLLGIGEDRMVTVSTPTTFARAVFLTAISHGNLADYPSALDELRRQLAPLTAKPPTHGRRLWLERGAALNNGGLTANRTEVYDCLDRYGFEVLDMATMSFAEQVRAASHARVLAGPHGAQFVHVQFMAPRSTVIECFSPVHVNPSVLQICRVLGHDYHQIVARTHVLRPYALGRDCQVDCELLSLLLSRLTDDATSNR